MARTGRVGWMVLLAGVTLPATARAGGFEFPDNGVEGMGRGGAFTAKADTPAALIYNIAGLAYLKGWHLHIDQNFAFLSQSFKRKGNYPDDTYTDSSTGQVISPTWSGQPYPTVTNSMPMNYIPMGAITNDFGLKRWTFAFGGYGPSSMGWRTFPQTVRIIGNDGKPVDAPAPQRFDVTYENTFVAFFTFAAAFRPWDWLAIGAAFQWTVAMQSERLVAMAYTGPNQCRSAEAYACQTKAGVDVIDPFAPTGIFAIHARPVNHLELGFQARLPMDARMTGSGVIGAPPALPSINIQATGAVLKTGLPWYLRAGARYYWGHRADERADIEFDATYETWSQIRSFHTDFQTSIGPLPVDTLYNYRDTYSLRLGGAYNVRLGEARLPVRAGVFFDRGASPQQYTRLDFDSFDRVGFTTGIGYKRRGWTVNLGLSVQYIPARNVENSQVYPLYPLLPATAADPNHYNDPGLNGRFKSTEVVAGLGVSLSLEEWLKRRSGLK